MTSQKMLLIFIILLLQISDTTGSECSDAAESNNIPYIRMCEDGSVTSDKVILDTYRAGSTGETTCSCTVNARLIFTIYAQRYGNGLNPNTSRCGSEVVVNDTSSGRERSFTCNTSPEQILYSRPMTITWSGGPCGDSKYCLNIKGYLILPNTTLTITCSKPATPTTPDSPTTTTTTTITTTTTTQGDVTSHEPATDVETDTKSVTQTTSTIKTSAVRCSCDEEGTIHLSVPAFATIIVFMCLIMLYATVVTILYDRRCLSSKNQHQNDNTNGTSSNIPGDEGYVNMPLPPSSDVLHVSDTTGSECSDVAESYNIPYIRMCEDGSVTSDKVILDTHSAGATGETTCSCTVNATLIFVIYIQHYGNELNPSTTGCGSEVVVNDTVTSGEKIRSFTCNTIAVQIIYSRPMTITWSGGPSGDSKYCLNITGLLTLPNTTFTITCNKPATPTTLQPTTSTTLTTTTTTQGDVTSHEPATGVETDTKSVTQTTSATKTSAVRCNCEEDGTVHLSVPAFATIIVFMCLIMLYATVVTILYDRRYLSLKNQLQNDNAIGTTHSTPRDESYENMPLPPSSDSTYEGLELSHVDLSPNTYEVLGNSGT
ncbi:mucin-5AC-like isoform X3 [Mizuhopecten yessoensis]|uniref:mucin-5AC-like isoform X3 n=1 Tax=Mizuhopecten yessoensis TaxID=6573 RepID=UPI000B45ACBA|nr:mucin-5AC-like isoform X3 [Mizuhopecten yessoensis]